MSSLPTAAERAVSLHPQIPSALRGRKGGAIFLYLYHLRWVWVLELQGRDDVLSKTQEKDSEPQSFEGPTWSLTFLGEILSWGVASMPAYYA